MRPSKDGNKGAFNQRVSVERADEEDEVSSPISKIKISWKTIFVAGISVEDFPDIEAPLVKDVIDAFLIRMSESVPKMVKGGLLREHGIDIEDMTNLIRFINEDRIEVDGVVLRSPT